MLRGAASARFVFFQLPLERLHDLGVLVVQVGRFAGILGQVVKLARRVRRAFRQGELFHAPFAFAPVVVSAGALVVEVLPVAMADGQGQADRLVQCVFADRLVARLAKQHRQNVVAVLGGVRRNGCAGQRRTGGHHVGEADGLRGGAAVFDLLRPAVPPWFYFSANPSPTADWLTKPAHRRED